MCVEAPLWKTLVCLNVAEGEYKMSPTGWSKVKGVCKGGTYQKKKKKKEKKRKKMKAKKGKQKKEKKRKREKSKEKKRWHLSALAGGGRIRKMVSADA